jgi:uncharacterized protein (DUF58 family)
VTRRPTRRAFALAGGALALFVVGTNVQAGWVLVIAALLAGTLAVGVLAPLRGSAGVAVSRRVPRTATAGQLVPVTIGVTNTGARTRWLLGVFDDFCGRGAAVVGLLRPGETREYAGRRTGARRGVHAAGPCTIMSGGPFGVAKATRTAPVSSPIVVYPRTYDAPLRRLAGTGTWRAPAAFGDTSSVRDYTRGDPLKHVHWRSTARRGVLMVREFDVEKRAEATIAAEAPADADGADAVASIACSFALSFLGSGEVRLLAAGEDAVVARDRDTLLEWGARLAHHADGAGVFGALDPSAALVCVCPASTAGAEALRGLAAEASLLAVLVTDRADDARAVALAEQLRAAGARAAVVSRFEVDQWFANGCAH